MINYLEFKYMCMCIAMFGLMDMHTNVRSTYAWQYNGMSWLSVVSSQSSEMGVHGSVWLPHEWTGNCISRQSVVKLTTSGCAWQCLVNLTTNEMENAWRYDYLQRVSPHVHCSTLQHTATHCNTLQHTVTHCNVLQRTETHCNTL